MHLHSGAGRKEQNQQMAAPVRTDNPIRKLTISPLIDGQFKRTRFRRKDRPGVATLHIRLRK